MDNTKESLKTGQWNINQKKSIESSWNVFKQNPQVVYNFYITCIDIFKNSLIVVDILQLSGKNLIF